VDPGKSIFLEGFMGDLLPVVEEIVHMLDDKNRKYGDSALNPVRIFSRANAEEQLLVRIDDKLKRIQTTGQVAPDEDTVKDLIGYLILLRMAQKRRK
jgi:hypothetical protein